MTPWSGLPLGRYDDARGRGGLKPIPRKPAALSEEWELSRLDRRAPPPSAAYARPLDEIPRRESGRRGSSASGSLAACGKNLS